MRSIKTKSMMIIVIILLQQVNLNEFSQKLLFIGEMMFLNEASLLNNIRRRYYNNKIYVRFMFLEQFGIH